MDGVAIMDYKYRSNNLNEFDKQRHPWLRPSYSWASTCAPNGACPIGFSQLRFMRSAPPLGMTSLRCSVSCLSSLLRLVRIRRKFSVLKGAKPHRHFDTWLRACQHSPRRINFSLCAINWQKNNTPPF